MNSLPINNYLKYYIEIIWKISLATIFSNVASYRKIKLYNVYILKMKIGNCLKNIMKTSLKLIRNETKQQLSAVT